MKQFRHKAHSKIKSLPQKSTGYTPKNDELAEWRSSKRWKTLRVRIITKYHGLCVYCAKALAEHVHHIKPAADFPDLFWDDENLAPLCEQCHGWMGTRTKRGEDVERQLRPKMKVLLAELKGNK